MKSRYQLLIVIVVVVVLAYVPGILRSLIGDLSAEQDRAALEFLSGLIQWAPFLLMLGVIVFILYLVTGRSA